jgi:hypothetical protein
MPTCTGAFVMLLHIGREPGLELAFVSVTQSFNTSSSMGRLTLNVLLGVERVEGKLEIVLGLAKSASGSPRRSLPRRQRPSAASE